MKKSIFLSSILTIGILLFGMRTASAIALNINPDNIDTTGLSGTTVSSTVSITGLSAPDEIVSAYDFDILYDAALLSVSSVTFNPLDSIFDLSFWFDNGAGVLTVSDLSFDSDAYLAGVQGDSVDLFTIDFLVLADGVATLSAAFDPSIPTCVVGRDAQCLRLVSTSVPEPSIIALLGFGLAGMVFVRRRKA
jgi:hypothetical protein